MGKTKSKGKKQTKKKAKTAIRRVDLRLPSDAAEFESERALLITEETLIQASATSCFDVIAKELEEPAGWDPLIVEAKPMSKTKRSSGAVSQLTLDLGGHRLQSPAVVTLYKTDRSLAWVLVNRPKIKEYWRLEPDKHGTVVHLSLGYELSGSIVIRFLQSLFYSRRIKQQVHWILQGLRGAIETNI
jgi:ribosome-associated toxin RatA of RatAB toxin-antitoxin module